MTLSLHEFLHYTALTGKLESGKQSSVGQVDCKPQQSCWNKHFKVEYKLVCLQDIMAYDLKD